MKEQGFITCSRRQFRSDNPVLGPGILPRAIEKCVTTKLVTRPLLVGTMNCEICSVSIMKTKALLAVDKDGVHIYCSDQCKNGTTPSCSACGIKLSQEKMFRDCGGSFVCTKYCLATKDGGVSRSAMPSMWLQSARGILLSVASTYHKILDIKSANGPIFLIYRVVVHPIVFAQSFVDKKTPVLTSLRQFSLEHGAATVYIATFGGTGHDDEYKSIKCTMCYAPGSDTVKQTSQNITSLVAQLTNNAIAEERATLARVR